MNIPKVVVWGENGHAFEVEFDGRRLSIAQFIEALKELASIAEVNILSNNELEDQLDEAAESGYNEGFSDAKAQCARDQQEKKLDHYGRPLPQEAIERLSDRVSPSIDSHDIAKVIFELSDYNDDCKKA